MKEENYIRFDWAAKRLLRNKANFDVLEGFLKTLLEVDKAARDREEVILEQLKEKEPLPDKEKDQMAWVRAANQHRAIAEEIILKELIYA